MCAIMECHDPTEKEVEIRWAVSGNHACSIKLTPHARRGEVKSLVFEQTGIPIEEQHIFVEGHETFGESLVDVGLADGQLMLLRSVSDPCITNLARLRASMDDFEPLARGKFTVVRKLRAGIHGDILKCRWEQDDRASKCVAVKKLRNDSLESFKNTETNERTIHMEPTSGRSRQPHAEDPLSEIGVLMYLCRQDDLPQYLVRMLGVYADTGFTWLVSEFAEGGDLFDVVATQSLGETRVQRFAWQLLQAVAYLHRHKIGHRDISLENILLKDGVAKLMDFGMAVQTTSASGVPLRYFRCVGKENFRAPEMYVPQVSRIRVAAPTTLAPNRVAMVETSGRHFCEVRFPEESKAGQLCMADVWGYTTPPVDVFASGVCLFTMACNCPPWHRAQLADNTFSWVHRRGDEGIKCLMEHWNKQTLGTEPMKLLAEMLRSDPTRRPSAASCLQNAWFTTTDAAEAT